MGVPFIGRDDELRALGALIAAARRARAPTAALVAGEPGSGKSRLLREVLRGTDPQRTILVSGFEPIEPIPLAALGDLVRRLAAVPDHGARLEALVFGSADGGGQTALPVFEAAHRALEAFGPLVLAIDDLQWVDTQSIALLQYLIRAAESTGQPLAVVAVSRPSTVASTFERGIEAPLPAARRLSLHLGPLGRDEGIALVHLIRANLDEHEAEDLWRRAAGSPFWLEALARERGATDPLDIVGDRLRLLSADAAELVSTLAVVARPVAREELEALTGWPTARLDQAIRTLVTGGLISEQPGTVQLAHDLIREAAAAALPTATARRLHARAVEVIEENAGGDLGLLAEALDHRTSAGVPVVPLAKRLVASPGRRLMGPDLFGRLSAIAASAPDGTADQLELDAALGTLATEQGEHELAIRHWSRVARTAPGTRERRRADREAAWAAYETGRAAEVHLHLDRARSGPLDAVTEIQLDTVEAESLLWIEHQTATGAARARQALARGRKLAAAGGGMGALPREARFALLGALGVAIDGALQEERAIDVVPLAREALELADGLGDEARLATLIRAGFPFWGLGMWREAEEWFREAWALSHRLILPVSMIEAGMGLTRVLLHLGSIAEAQAIAKEADALEARLQPWGRWDTTETLLHLIELSLGERGAIDRLRAGAQRVDPHFAINIHQSAAIWLSRLGERSAATEVEAALEAARACSAQAQCPRCDRELLVITAELHAHHGRVDEARRELVEWESRYQGPGYPALHAWRARAQAAIAVASGDPAAAQLLAEVVRTSEDMAGAEDAVWARLDLGRFLRASGDRQLAIATYTDAAARARKLGAVSAARIATRALRDLGVRAWRRPAGEPRAGALAELSTRELEIARLVADGSSNKEIAELLALSSKTVARHLTNTLAKVGARNRTELAAVVHASSTATQAPPVRRFSDD